MPPRVLVTRKLPAAALELLRGKVTLDHNFDDLPLGPAALRQRLAEAEGLICLLTDRIDAAVLDAAPRLKIVANVAVGHDNVDLAAASARGILVTNTPGILTETTADLTWALILAAARRIVPADGFARAGKYTEWRLDLFLGRDVHGQTLGICGLGRIGRAVARRARGFGLTVLYADRSRAPLEVERELGAGYVGKEELLRRSDIVSLHLPYGPEVRHYIGAPELRLMKPTAILINTARGPLVDEAALAEALREKRLWAAGLDVYELEPKIHPELRRLENCVLLPHLGSASEATRTAMARLAVENCLAALIGQRPANLVNPEVFLAAGRRK